MRDIHKIQTLIYTAIKLVSLLDSLEENIKVRGPAIQF